MARESIFEILETGDELGREVARIDSLFTHAYHLLNNATDWHSITIEEYVDQYLLAQWDHRQTFTSTAEIREKLHIDALLYEVTADNVLTYLEYVENIIYLLFRNINDRIYAQEYNPTTQRYDRIKLTVNNNFQMLLRNIGRLEDRLGYETIIDDSQRIFLVQKDAAATAAADVLGPEGMEVFRYNSHLLKGDLKQKRAILVSLGRKVEALFKTLDKNNLKFLTDDAGFLLNNLNIRHNNEDKNSSFYKNLNEQELEKWYDETFQVLLLCILQHDHVERRKRIADLKANPLS